MARKVSNNFCIPIAVKQLAPRERYAIWRTLSTYGAILEDFFGGDPWYLHGNEVHSFIPYIRRPHLLWVWRKHGSFLRTCYKYDKETLHDLFLHL